MEHFEEQSGGSPLQELEVRLENLEMALEAAQIGTWQLNLQTGQAVHSRRHDLLLGYSEAQPDWSPEIAAAHVLPEDRPRYEASFAQALANGKYELECRVRWPDNTIHWILSTGQLYVDDKGQPNRLGGVVMDITERKQIEEQAQKTNERFEITEAATNGFIYDWEIGSDQVWRSEGLSRVLGYRPDEIAPTETGWLSLIHPDDLADTQAAMSKVINNPLGGSGLEYRVRHKDGHYLDMLDRSVAIRDEQGRLKRLLGSTIDISWRKRQERNATLLAEIMADFAVLSHPTQIMQSVAKRLYSHLGLLRAAFVEVNEAEGEAINLYDYQENDAKSGVGHIRLSNVFSPAFADQLQTGQPVVINDLYQDPRTAPFVEIYKPYGVGSQIFAPYQSDGQWKFVLCVQKSEPYVWREDEIALLQELASRTWLRLERAQAEEALRESETRLRIATRLSRMASFELDIASGLVVFDDNAAYLYGLENNQAGELPQDWRQLVQNWLKPGDAERHKNLLLATMRGEVDLYNEIPVRNPQSGEESWIETYATLVRDEAGKPSRVVGVMLNITERKQAENNLAFLAEISRDFAPLTTVEKLMNGVGEKLARYLGLSRCDFSRVDVEDDRITVLYDWRRAENMPSVLGEQSISNFLSEAGRRQYVAGNLSVVDDVYNSSLVGGSPELFEQLGIRSVVDAPYLKNGRWKFLLSASRAEPGKWRSDEIELIRELAARIYIRLERAYAEEALHESEAKYRTLFESIDEGYSLCEIITDEGGKPVDYRFLEVNPAFEKMSGIEPETALNNTARHLAPDLDDRLLETYGKVALAGEAFRFENWVADLDKWFDVYVGPVGEKGSGKFVGTFTDITERKRAEQALLQSEKRFREVARITSDAIWDWNLITDELWWNEGVTTLFGYKTAEVGLDINWWYDHIHPDDRERVKNGLQATITNKQTQWSDEYRFRHADGSYRNVSDRGFVLTETERDSDGPKPVRMVGAMVDVTRQKQEESQARFLIEFGEKLRPLSEEKVVFERAARLLGEYLGVNRAYFAEVETNPPRLTIQANYTKSSRLLSLAGTYPLTQPGWLEELTQPAPIVVNNTAQEGLPSGFYNLLYRESQVRAVLSVPLLRQEATQRKSRDKDKQAQNAPPILIVVLEQHVPHHWLGEELTLVRVVLERVWLAVQNARLLRQARLAAITQERNRIGRYLHDSLQQDFYSIGLNINTLRALLPQLNTDPDRENLASYQQILTVLNELRAISEGGLSGLRTILFDLRTEAVAKEGLVAGLENYLTSLETKHRLKIKSALGKEPKIDLEVKEVLYWTGREALYNIIKHARASEVEINLNYTASTGAAWVELVIKDNGVGFEPQKMADSSSFGLKLMRERVQEYGGKFTLSSTPGKGTTVRVRFKFNI